MGTLGLRTLWTQALGFNIIVDKIIYIKPLLTFRSYELIELEISQRGCGGKEAVFIGIHIKVTLNRDSIGRITPEKINRAEVFIFTFFRAIFLKIMILRDLGEIGITLFKKLPSSRTIFGFF